MHLKSIIPTPEQRRVFFLQPNRPILLTGRAGSGKTTVAILRAAQLGNFYKRQGIDTPRIGIFVFNNTLKDYLDALASRVLSDVEFEVHVFDAWCRDFLEKNDLINENIADDSHCKNCLGKAIQHVRLASKAPQISMLGNDFLIDEISYLVGRFGSDTVRYINMERKGRGEIPRIGRDEKRLIAEELLPAYLLYLEANFLMDWSQVRERTLTNIILGESVNKFDILIIDEAQDLSATQVKIALSLVSEETNSITFIRDTTQKIYKNDYIWEDINMEFQDKSSRLDLIRNYRNTRRIAQAAASLMQPLFQEEDVDVINPELTEVEGEKPIWLLGKYTEQKAYLIQCLANISIQDESVCILHIKSDEALNLATEISQAGYYCKFLKDGIQEDTPGTIYTSTLHSVKGLDFDHIFIIGYDSFFIPGNRPHRNTSAHLDAHRKLLYVAMTRARKTLTITSHFKYFSPFLEEIDKETLQIICLR